MFTLSSLGLLVTLVDAPSALVIALALPGLATLGLILGWRRGAGSMLQIPPPFIPPLPFLRDVLALFESELARARRYERPFSMLVLRFGAGAQPSALGHAGLILLQSIRESDIASFDAATGRFVIALPECERAAAQAAGERLREILRMRTGVEFVASCATFPFEALILGDLIEVAAANHSRPGPTIVSGLQPLVGRARLRTHTQREEP